MRLGLGFLTEDGGSGEIRVGGRGWMSLMSCTLRLFWLNLRMKGYSSVCVYVMFGGRIMCRARVSLFGE